MWLMNFGQSSFFSIKKKKKKKEKALKKIWWLLSFADFLPPDWFQARDKDEENLTSN